MVIRFFYYILYQAEKTENEFLKLNAFRFLSRAIRVFLPIYYTVFRTNKLGIAENKSSDSQKIIISLTSFPPRMGNLWVVLESLLRQSKKPDKIILWLAHDQFPNTSSINKKVLKMKDRGLEIRFCDDLKSHKKYYYTMLEYNDDLIITVDDDIFQPENLVENLLKKHKEFPNNIVCYRAHLITLTNNHVNSYKDWLFQSPGISGPSMLLMATNGAGALYPPRSISKEVFNKDAIIKYCPTADDIWLKCMSYLKGTSTIKVHKSYPRLLSTKVAAKTGLAKTNVDKGENDKQLKKVMEIYNIKFFEK
ncbi:hypothetical protein [Virgibacillus sp. Bac330]|uniref:hypothetical protein n=1 Tax=Virgibacillus sp. Bac330 TaxID=2419841 RepID=UPI000EF5524D|nr:hypothetical protein [Virgibacillus sp. Bac330]